MQIFHGFESVEHFSCKCMKSYGKRQKYMKSYGKKKKYMESYGNIYGIV